MVNIKIQVQPIHSRKKKIEIKIEGLNDVTLDSTATTTIQVTQ
jgi:hypothetical protein